MLMKKKKKREEEKKGRENSNAGCRHVKCVFSFTFSFFLFVIWCEEMEATKKSLWWKTKYRLKLNSLILNPNDAWHFLEWEGDRMRENVISYMIYFFVVGAVCFNWTEAVSLLFPFSFCFTSTLSASFT